MQKVIEEEIVRCKNSDALALRQPCLGELWERHLGNASLPLAGLKSLHSSLESKGFSQSPEKKKKRWPLPQTIKLYLLPDYALKSTYRCLIQEGFCAPEQVPKRIPLIRYLNTENSVSYFSAFYCLFASSCNFPCTGSPWCLHLDFLFHSGEQTHKYARLSSNLTLRHQTSFHLCIILFPERIQLY